MTAVLRATSAHTLNLTNDATVLSQLSAAVGHVNVGSDIAGLTASFT